MQGVAPVNFEAIPQELKAYPNWVLWKYITKEGKDKPSKVPHSAHTLRPCSSTKPEDWCAFETVCRVFEGGGFDGLGFVFTEEAGILGVDIDGETDFKKRSTFFLFCGNIAYTVYLVDLQQ